MKTLFATSFLFLAVLSAAHADDDRRAELEGFYKLSRDTYGMCSPDLRVFNQGADNGGTLFAGGYFFPAINGGVRKEVSDIDVTTQQTTLRGLDMVYREHRVSRTGDENVTTVNEVKLSPNKNVLTLRSQNWGTFTTITLCTYVRAKDPNDTNF